MKSKKKENDHCNTIISLISPSQPRGWSGWAMVLGKLTVLVVLLIWIRVGQGPTALAVGAGRGCLACQKISWKVLKLLT